MEGKSKVIKNYIYNLCYQITSLLVPFVTIPYISRIFGPEGVGSYSVAYAIAQSTCLVGMMGLGIYSMREIAYNRDSNERCRIVFWNLNYVRFFSMGLVVLVYAFIVCKYVRSRLYYSQLFTLFASLFDVSWYYAGVEKFKITAIRSIIVKILGTIFVFIFVKTKNDVWVYSLILALSVFIGQVVMWRPILKRFKVVKPSISLIKRYSRETIRFWIPAIAINVYTSLDKIMLGIIVGDEEAGLYENSQKMIKMVSTVTTTFTTVMTPKMANLFSYGNIDEIRKKICDSFRFVTMIAAPMLFGVLAVRNTFVYWYFGEGFERIGSLLLISSWLILTLSWSNVIGNQVLIACNMEKKYTEAVVGGAIINILLNSILIPRYACVGAILSSVIAEYFGMIMMLIFAKGVVSIVDLFRNTKNYYLISIIMYIVSYYTGIKLGNTIKSTVFQTIIGCAIYFIGLLKCKDPYILLLIKKFKLEKVRKSE